MKIFQKLSYIAEVEFSDITETVEESEDKLRIYLIDGSFIDVWFSIKIPIVRLLPTRFMEEISIK